MAEEENLPKYESPKKPFKGLGGSLPKPPIVSKPGWEPSIAEARPYEKTLPQTSEVMYTNCNFTPQQAVKLGPYIPDLVRTTHTDIRAGVGRIAFKEITLTVLLEEDLDLAERQSLETKYRARVSATRLIIELMHTDLAFPIAINFDDQSGNVTRLVGNMAPSVISQQFQILRERSPFIRRVFEEAKIPELTDEQAERAAKAVEQNKKELVRLNLIQPETTGICESLETAALDSAMTIVVGQKGYAYGHPLLPHARILETYGLADCVAVVAYDEEKSAGFLAHLDRVGSVREALNLIRSRLGDKAKLVIYGGQGQAGNVTHAGGSREILAAIEDQLRGLEVIGKDTLGSSSRAIALDTLTGNIFIPEQIVLEDDRRRKQISVRPLELIDQLHNDGAFLAEVNKAIKGVE